MGYCTFANSLSEDSDNPNKHYHDYLYGFPVTDDNELFGRLLLEINQAGLSWTLILQRASAFRAAYAGFDIAAVAAFGEADCERLLGNAGIIRNRRKIEAVIYNARQIRRLQQQFGSFGNWLDRHHPQELSDWVALFKRTFKFTGSEIVREFLVSTGYLKGAHTADCPVAGLVAAANPPWMRK